MPDKAEHGGLQIIVYPMKHDVYVEHFERLVEADMDFLGVTERLLCEEPSDLLMGLAPGGLMRQTISEDKYGIDAWDQDNGYRCFIHLANSVQYQAITGHRPPHRPATAKEYTDAGLPWFDYYDDSKALAGADALSKLTSVAAKVIETGKGLLPDNEPVQPAIIKIVSKEGVVRDGDF